MFVRTVCAQRVRRITQERKQRAQQCFISYYFQIICSCSYCCYSMALPSQHTSNATSLVLENNKMLGCNMRCRTTAGFAYKVGTASWIRGSRRQREASPLRPSFIRRALTVRVQRASQSNPRTMVDCLRTQHRGTAWPFQRVSNIDHLVGMACFSNCHWPTTL